MHLVVTQVLTTATVVSAIVVLHVVVVVSLLPPLVAVFVAAPVDAFAKPLAESFAVQQLAVASILPVGFVILHAAFAIAVSAEVPLDDGLVALVPIAVAVQIEIRTWQMH